MLVILLGAFLPIVCAVAMAFIVLYYVEKSEGNKLHKLLMRKKILFPTCNQCGQEDMPTTYPNEAEYEQICWKCLAENNWKIIKELEDE